MWIRCTWSAVLVSAAVLFSKPCNAAEIVRNASVIWTPEKEFVLSSSRPSGTLELQPWRRQHSVFKRHLAAMFVVAPIVALAFLVVSCMRKASDVGSSVRGITRRYLAVGGSSPCDAEEKEDDEDDPSQQLSHPQLSLLTLSPAEANRLSPQDLQTITNARKTLTDLLRIVAELQREAEESTEQELTLNADLAIAQTDRVIMGAAASHALMRRKREKAEPASEKLDKYKAILRTMEPQEGQRLQELLLVARSFASGRPLTFNGAAALVASTRINNPEVAMPAALQPQELSTLKELIETMISEGRIHVVRLAFLGRSSQKAVPRAREFVGHAETTASYLEQAGLSEEAARLTEVTEELEKLIASLPPVATTSRKQSLLKAIAEGQAPDRTSVRTSPVWLPRVASKQHLQPSLLSGAIYKDAPSAGDPYALFQQDLPRSELPDVPAAITPPLPGVGGEPLPAVPVVRTPSSTKHVDAVLPVGDSSPAQTEHTASSAADALSPGKLRLQLDSLSPSAVPSLDWSLPPRPDGRPSASGSRFAQKLKTWVQRTKSAISGQASKGGDIFRLELLLREAVEIFQQAPSAELATQDAQQWVHEANVLIDRLRLICSARWRLRCAQQRLRLLDSRESLIFLRAASPREKLPEPGDVVIRSIMAMRAIITVANHISAELKPFSTTPSPFPELADALQNLQSEVQEAEDAVKEEALRIVKQFVTALQDSAGGDPAAEPTAPSSSSPPTSSIILQAKEILALLKQWVPSSLEFQALEEQLLNLSQEEALTDPARSRWRSARWSLSLRRRKTKKQSKRPDKKDEQ